MRIKPSKRLIGALAGVLVIIVGGTATLWWAQRNALAATLRELREKRAELEDSQLVVRRREQALAALEKDRSELRYLETGVSEMAYVPTLLKQLEERAVRTRNRVLGVRQQATEVAPTRLQQRRDPEAQAKAEEGGGNSGGQSDEKKMKEEPYTPLRIQVNLVGSFASTQAFLQELMRFPKIVSVDEMQIRPHTSSDPKEAAASLLAVELKVTAYVMKERPTGQPQLTALADTGGIR